MVITRSGTNVRRHAVRFKKGADVRRVLEYDEDDWSYKNSDSEAENVESQSSLVTQKTYGPILMNGTAHNTHYATGNQFPSIQSSDNSDIDNTILYDIEERDGRSWLWDALLFVVVTLLCYTTAFVLYSSWGHGLYLTLATLCIIVFSYNVTYFDSTKPGIVPPSPVSPLLYRHMSGHTYHLTYVMSVVNGLVFLAVEPYIRNMVIPPV